MIYIPEKSKKERLDSISFQTEVMNNLNIEDHQDNSFSGSYFPGRFPLHHLTIFTAGSNHRLKLRFKNRV